MKERSQNPGARSQPITEIVPLEYSGERPDLRAPLVQGGEMGGVFVNRTLAEQTRQFLARFPKGPSR